MGKRRDVDMQACEHCEKSFPIETMTSMEDYWFCKHCVAEWQKCFESCTHDWQTETHYSTMGDEGRVCNNCCGFVSYEDAPGLGITFPPLATETTT